MRGESPAVYQTGQKLSGRDPFRQPIGRLSAWVSDGFRMAFGRYERSRPTFGCISNRPKGLMGGILDQIGRAHV